MIADHPNQECGECSECCRHLIVDSPELTKVAGHLCGACVEAKGCSIYQSRPQVCRSFVCSWQKLPLSSEWRPDRSQIMIIHEPANPEKGVREGIKFFFIGSLDRVFWRPFIDFVSMLIAQNQQIYVSVPSRAGYYARMLPIEPVPELIAAARVGNKSAIVGVVSALLQACKDAPEEAVVFAHKPAARLANPLNQSHPRASTPYASRIDLA